jgi:1,4-dihydroxy-6-naphthoate synthase
VETEVVPFDEIIEHVAEGRADAGLIIHEGQLTFGDARGPAPVADLGEWWAGETGGLPLPLGGNVIRRDLGDDLIRRVSRLLRESIAYGLEHRAPAIAHARSTAAAWTRARPTSSSACT